MFDQQFRRRSKNATASPADITPRPIVVASSAGCRRMCPPSIGRAPTRHALRPSPAASGAGLGPSSSLRASDASDLRGGDERDPIALVRIAVRPCAVGDRRLGPDPPLAPAQLHQSDVAQLRRRRVRRWRRGRDHLVLVGTPQPYRPQSHGRRHGRGAGCLSQGRADRSSADHADGVAALAGRWSRLGRPAASRVGGQSRVTDASDRTARRSRPPRAS